MKHASQIKHALHGRASTNRYPALPPPYDRWPANAKEIAEFGFVEPKDFANFIELLNAVDELLSLRQMCRPTECVLVLSTAQALPPDSAPRRDQQRSADSAACIPRCRSLR